METWGEVLEFDSVVALQWFRYCGFMFMISLPAFHFVIFTSVIGDEFLTVQQAPEKVLRHGRHFGGTGGL